MSDAEISEHVLRYSTDEGSINKAVAGVERIKGSFAELNKAAGDAARPLAEVSKSADMSDADRRVAELLDRIEDLKREAAELRKAFASAFDEAADGAGNAADEAKRLAQAERESAEKARLYGDVESRTRAITGAVGYVGGAAGESFERTANIGAELLSTTEAVGLLSQELPKLVAQLNLSRLAVGGFGIAAVGAVAAGYAIHKMLEAERKEREKAREAIQKHIEMIKEYASVVATSTADEVQEAIAGKEVILKNLEVQRDRYQRYLQVIADATRLALTGQVAELTEESVEVFRMVHEEYGGQVKEAAKAWGEALTDTNTSIRESERLIKEWKDGLDEGATASADAAQRAAELASNTAAESRERIALLTEVADASKTMSAEQARDQIAGWESRRAIMDQERTRLEALQDLQGIDTSEEVVRLGDAIDELDQKIATFTGDVIPAAEERERETAIIQSQIAAIQDEADTRIQTEELIKSASSDQLESRLAGIELERLTLERMAQQLSPLAGSSEEAANKLAEVQDKLADLGDEEVRIKVRVLPEVEARERMNVLREFADESVAIEEERAQSILGEQVDFERQRLRDLAGHYQDIAKLDADAARKEADLLKDQADEQADLNKDETKARQEHYRDLEKLSEDHQERLRQIQNDAQTDYEEAARRRDTSGALAAIRRGERELKDEKDQYEKERQERTDALNERLVELNEERDEKRQAGIEALADLREQNQRERAERIADFQQKLAEEDEDRRISLERQQQAWDDEDQKRRQHYADQLGLTEDKLQEIYDTTKSYLDDTATAFEDAVNIMYNKAAELLTEAERSVTEIEQRRAQGYRGGHQDLEAFAGGGTPTPGDVVKVGEHGMEYARFLDPVHIYTRDQAKTMMGGSTTLNVTLGGLGGVQITASPGLSARGIAEQAGGQLANLVIDALEEIVSAYEAGG